MTSKILPKSSSTQENQRPNKRRRIANLYDAVADRVGYEGFLPTSIKASKFRDTSSTSTTPLPPEEVLFRRKNAPLRFEEDDVYFRAYRHLDEQQLPNSDLLKVLHGYAAELYATNSSSKSRSRDEAGSMAKRKARRSERAGAAFYSMDETALLALGILLEEAAAEAVEKPEIMDELLEPG